MPKTLKLTLIAFLSLAFLMTMIIGSIFLFVDPNDYKDEITTAVQQTTGRELTINGDIKLSIYPWLGLSLGATQLSNAKGFGDTPFASVDAVEIKVKLLPLFQQRLEMQKIRLHGLHANLTKNEQGRNNWDDLSAAPETPSTDFSAKKPTTPTAKTSPESGTTEPTRTMAALSVLAIDGLELENAHLEWHDLQTNQHIIIDKLTLRTGPLALPAPIDLSLSLDIQMNNPEIDGHVDFSGQISFDLETQQLINISHLQLSALGSTIKGQVNITELDTAPGASGDITVTISDPARLLKAVAIKLPQGFRAEGLANAELTTSFDISQQTQTANLKKLSIKAAGVDIKGGISVTQFLDSPVSNKLKVSGNIAIAQFSPRDVAKKIGVALPNTHDATILNKAQLKLEFYAGLNEATVKNLSVMLDDTELTGKASVKNFTKPVTHFDLKANGIDVDRYLPPASPTPRPTPTTTPSPGSAATANAIQLPIESLRNLTIDGKLNLGKLKVAGAQLSEIKLGIKAKKGRFDLQPIQALLYKGSYKGRIALDVRTETPKISLNGSLKDVNAGPLLKDVMGEERVSGMANVSTQLTTTGIDLESLKKTLNGKAHFSFRDGAVKGVNLGQMIREANAKLKNKSAPPKTKNETDFAEMTGSIIITNGIVHNKDLKAKTPLLRINGKGNVSLPQEKIKYLVNASIVESDEGQAGKELKDLKSLTIPIKVTGTFDKPKYELDLGPVLQARAKKLVEIKKKQLQKDIDKRMSDEKKKIRKNLEDELKKRFKIKF